MSLHFGVIQNNLEEVQRIIDFFGGNVNAKDEGITPLIRAVIMGNLDMVDLLLANDADVNAVDGDGFTPLMRAVLREDLDIAKVLIQNGAILDEEADIILSRTPSEFQREINSAIMLKRLDFPARFRRELTGRGTLPRTVSTSSGALSSIHSSLSRFQRTLPPSSKKIRRKRRSQSRRKVSRKQITRKSKSRRKVSRKKIKRKSQPRRKKVKRRSQTKK